MQNQFADFTNKAIAINTGLISKSVTQNVEAGQAYAKRVSEQAEDSLNIKNFDDFVANQKDWSSLVVEQSQETFQAMVDLGNEAYDAYALLWKKALTPAATTAPRVVKAKAA